MLLPGEQHELMRVPMAGPMSNTTCALTGLFAQLGALALVGAATFSLSTNSAAADPGLDVLAGSWRGDGTLAFEGGKTESISCNGYYKGTGSLSVVIRCKGTSSNFELRSKLDSNGDKVSGSWEERTYNATGDVSGTASAGKLDIQFSGSLTGSLEMSFSASSQSGLGRHERRWHQGCARQSQSHMTTATPFACFMAMASSAIQSEASCSSSAWSRH
jgi:hypothetical protein